MSQPEHRPFLISLTRSVRRDAMCVGLCLVLMGAVLVAQRVVTIEKPYDRDLMVYAVIGHEMLNGAELYSGLWDHKPPAIYVSYAAAELLFGYGPHSIFVMNMLLSFLTLAGVYFAGRNAFGTSAGLWAAGLWTIVSAQLELGASEPNVEVFLNVLVVWSFALLLKNGFSWRRTAVIGILFALASLYKPVVIAAAALTMLAQVLFSTREGAGRKTAFAHALLVGAIGILSWSAVAGYFALCGRFAPFRDAVFTYNSYYAGDILRNLLAPWRGEAEVLPNALNILGFLTGTAVLLSLQQPRACTLLVAATGGAYLSIASPGRYFPHYYQLWLPILAVGSGWAIACASQHFSRARVRVLPQLAGTAAALALIMNQVPWYSDALAGDWRRMADNDTAAAGELAAKLDALLEPGETFFEWGEEPALFFYSRRPAQRTFLSRNFTDGPQAAELSRKTAEDLKRVQPALFVVRRESHAQMPPGNPVVDYFQQNYALLESESNSARFHIYQHIKPDRAAR